MTQWTAFVGFTGLVLSLFLLLARLSQRLVDGDVSIPVESDSPADLPSDAQAADPPSDSTTELPSGPSTDRLSDAPSDRPSDSSSDRPSDAAATRDPSDLDGVESADDGAADSDAGPSATGTANSDAGPPAPGAADRPLVAETATPERPLRSSEGTGREGSPGRHLSPGELLANVALTQGLFGALVAAAAWYFEVPAAALGLAEARVGGPAAVGLGVGFGLVLWVGNELASALADASGASYDEGLRTMLAPDSAGGWLLLLGVTLPVIAVVEEFLFRAAAVGAPAAGLGVSPWVLAVVSSVAFALGHGAQGRVGVVVTGALGFVLATGFVLSGSLLLVVVAHYLINALEFGVHEGLGLPDPVWS